MHNTAVLCLYMISLKFNGETNMGICFKIGNITNRYMKQGKQKGFVIAS